jgi:hypothetical protein
MPTDSDPKAASPIRRVITNDPAVANLALPGPVSGTTGQGQEEHPGERVELPSRGLAYDPKNPASKGFVMVRPITTKEEEILATERYHKQGIALDMILSRCILTKGIDTLDLLSGDRLHILFYLRAISYGPEYSFRARMKDGSDQDIKTDVSKLAINTLPEGFTEPWPVQVDGVTYELRLARGRDEQEAVRQQLAAKKKNPNTANTAPTDALKRQIVSINGEQDREMIEKTIDRMIARQAGKLRSEITKLNPGPRMKLTVINLNTGEPEEVAFQLTEAFFRSEAESD